MEIKIGMKFIKTVIALALLLFLSYRLYQYLKPVETIFIKNVSFSFREDVRKALKVEASPNEEVLYKLFTDYDMKNITILFKPGTPETNALYQIETFEIVYKLSKYDNSFRGFKPKKTFNAEEIESYENITREEGVLKIILVSPEFSNQTRVTGGGNRIWVYGKTDKEFDAAVAKAILSMMNVTNIEGYV